MIVTHSGGEYPIHFTDLASAIEALPVPAFVITDEKLYCLYGDLFSLHETLRVAPGEKSKSVADWAGLQSELAKKGAGRSSTIVAFGGGVVGDLAGFVAATFMRKIPFIQMPTSLLSQLDSSVGGKVGIDLPEGKNLVGAFYPPQAVYVCDDVLETLPEREFNNGMAEAWKAAFILDAGLVDDLTAMKLERSEIVRKCIDIKRQVVERDEFETLGDRAKLNFGHTIGHAIEKISGYGPILHGEAISIGMVAEAQLGEDLGITRPGTRARVEHCLSSQGLPTTSVLLRNHSELIETMLKDKKARDGRMAFSLLTQIGECKLIEGVDEAIVRRSLTSMHGTEL